MKLIFTSQKSGLPTAIVDGKEPINRSLAGKSLADKLLNQNPNESLNNLIWKRCPKKVHRGRKVVELFTASVVTHFNDGASSISAVLSGWVFFLSKIKNCDKKN